METKTLRYVTKAQKFISTFISHAAEDNEEARYYEKVLQKEGFSVFQFGHGLHLADHVRATVVDQIKKCHFFILIVSDFSLVSDWVQREIGLAIDLQHANKGYRPIIIPIFAKLSTWRKTGERPQTFPVLDFETGDHRNTFDLEVRGLDIYANPETDSAALLVSYMRPQVLVTRLDFDDEFTFDSTQLFQLYEDMFPIVERDSREDIIQWVLRTDLGRKRSFRLDNGTALSYRLDSRYFILTLTDRAMGFAFFTYDYASKLIYGNYIGVQECWRSGDIASYFLDEITKILDDELFPQNQGVVFEVETFDSKRIAGVIDYVRCHGGFASEDDKLEMRKFLRVTWYQMRECLFFLDNDTKEPLICKSPCLDPSQQNWSDFEEEYWIMWHRRTNTIFDIGSAKKLWVKAVRCIYIEILVKSLVEAYPDAAMSYWRYANSIVDGIIKRSETKNISFGKYLHRHDSPLLAQWVKLGIDLAI